MNKYQEVLNYLDWHCIVEHIHKVIYNNLDNLKELIDKWGVDTNESF